LFATRQHVGLALIAGVGFLALADAVGDRRFGAVPGPRLLPRLVTLGLGTMASAGLVMGPHAARAGIGPMFQELVVHPLTGYRAVNKIPWGGNLLFELGSYTWPALLAYLPAVVAFACLRSAVAWGRHRTREPAETVLVLAVFGVCSILFTLSFPDCIHIAF